MCVMKQTIFKPPDSLSLKYVKINKIKHGLKYFLDTLINLQALVDPLIFNYKISTRFLLYCWTFSRFSIIYLRFSTYFFTINELLFYDFQISFLLFSTRFLL